ncbi:MAG: hypothetical protein L0Y79_05640 [Chlorobi bacterium]|nr:hypothetical protein [Chlorobiota bacterium]
MLALRKRPQLRGKIEACFVGGLTMEDLNLIKKYNISDTVFNPGYLTHMEAIRYMLASDVLWFMVDKGEGADVIAPVKLSEYFGARKPILACVTDGAAKQLLRDYDAVRICEPDEPGEIAKLIIEYYDLYEKNSMPAANEELIKKFDVDKLAYQLVRYFEFLRDIPPGFGIKEKEMLGQD